MPTFLLSFAALFPFLLPLVASDPLFPGHYNWAAYSSDLPQINPKSFLAAGLISLTDTATFNAAADLRCIKISDTQTALSLVDLEGHPNCPLKDQLTLFPNPDCTGTPILPPTVLVDSGNHELTDALIAPLADRITSGGWKSFRVDMCRPPSVTAALAGVPPPSTPTRRRRRRRRRNFQDWVGRSGF